MVIPKVVKSLLAKVAKRSAVRPAYRNSGDAVNWEVVRRPAVESDIALMDLARRLLDTMPAYARPRLLSARHPRIVNRLAEVWLDPARIESYLNSLLVDQRGNRSGFAPSIRAELVRLSFFYAKLKAEPGALAKWKKELQ